ncbi:UbiD family decarboxylase [Halegenticoccus soli]|uniref:UbiD family decarboxylase domain-containing protein n=1 Tax=Halegenticoccus soli TaxID=1985678 RepID=UPI000C6E61AE|nr:UbiD family decarboxylase domain-containing protein [Halegenticoccus soli]
MTTLREHVAALDGADDLLRIEQRVHWATDAPAIAAEAARENGPAILFENVPGTARLVSGAYGGPDQMQPRTRMPWSRVAVALGRDGDLPYTRLLQRLSATASANATPTRTELAATYGESDPYSLGLPAVGSAAGPAVTLGLIAVSADDGTTWAPIRGAVKGSAELVASVPAALGDSLSPGTDATIALGAPLACLVAAALRWTGDAGYGDPLGIAGTLDEVSVAEARGGLVPASAEAILDGTVSDVGGRPSRRAESWEYATSTTEIGLRLTDIALRDDPLIPFTPVGAPLADDIHLAGLVEAARLYHRLNSYWGVTPVEWIALPVETKLGMCLVASEILYAGFEWQLANTLFSFSRLFDKVLVLDADAPAATLARAFDDMWVKAHPSHDWQFSEPAAPAATATAYRRDGTPGSRLYINATWDPRWDDEYIAPRVGFETSFPDDVREFVLDNWRDMGFSSTPEEEE